MFLVIGALILLVLGILVLVFSFLDITNTMIFSKDASDKRKRRRYDILFLIVGTLCIVVSGVLYRATAREATRTAREAARTAQEAARTAQEAVNDGIGAGTISVADVEGRGDGNKTAFRDDYLIEQYDAGDWI